jgi:hypothetical protein
MKKTIGLMMVRIAVVSSLIVIAAPGAMAQWNNPYWGTTWKNPTSSLLQTMAMNKVFSENMRRSIEQKNKPLNQGTRPQQQKLTPYQQKSITFSPVADMIMPYQLAEKIGDTPENRKELQKAFVYFLEFFEQQAISDQEQYNVARAILFFIVYNYAIATGSVIGEGEGKILESDIKSYLGGNQHFCAYNDRQKQELYETLVILGTITAVGYDDGEKNGREEQMETFRLMARQNMQTLLGVPVEKVKFTKAGLVINK